MSKSIMPLKHKFGQCKMNVLSRMARLWRLKFLNFPYSKNNKSGFTLIEIIITSVIIGILLLGFANFGTYAGRVNRNTRVTRRLNEMERSITTNLSKRSYLFLNNLATQSCSTTSLTLTLPTNIDPAASVTLVDYAFLDTRLSAAQKTALDQLILDFPTNTTVKCSDTTRLAQPAYSAIGTSDYSMALCRCSVALTAYQTRRAKVASLATNSGVYFCGFVQATSTGNDPVAQEALLSTPLLLEGNISALNISNANTLNCNQISSVGTNQRNGRFEYSIHKLSATSINNKTSSGSLLTE